MKRFLLFIASILAVAGVAWAGADTPEMPTIEGRGLIAETETASDGALGTGAGFPFVGSVVFFEADDTAVYPGPTGVAIDTGTEACAVYGMSCAGVWTVTTGADADLTVVATCGTDVADGTQNLAFCF